MLFESGESCGVFIFAFRLVAFKDRGGCVAVEGPRGGGCERTIGVVVEEEGDQRAEGRKALFKVQCQRRSS